MTEPNKYEQKAIEIVDKSDMVGPAPEPPGEKVQAEFGVEPYPPEDAVFGACGILDVVKSEWGEAWSEHDQKVRAGLSRILSGQLLDGNAAERPQSVGAKSEPQQGGVTVPEDLRELYDLAKCGVFATLNKKIVSAIERLGAAEQRAAKTEAALSEPNTHMLNLATFLEESSVRCTELEAERDKLKDQNLILLNNADAFESKWRTLLSQLGAAEQEYGALESEHSRIVGAMLTERERLRNRLTDAERNVAILTEGCEVWEKRYAELEAERDRLKEQLAAVSSAHYDAVHDIQSVTRERDDFENQNAGLRAQVRKEALEEAETRLRRWNEDAAGDMLRALIDEAKG